MGASATAHLAFGVGLDERCPYDDHDGDRCFDEFLAEHHGLVNPWDHEPPGYPEQDWSLDWQEREDKYKRDMDAFKAEHADWFAEKEAYYDKKSELEKACPIAVVQNGDSISGWHENAIIIRGTEQYAWAGEFKPIEMAEVTPEQIEAARKACQELGMPPFDNPSWIIYSSYG